MVLGYARTVQLGTELGCSWDRAGMQLGPSWDAAGTELGSSWDPTGTKGYIYRTSSPP